MSDRDVFRTLSNIYFLLKSFIGKKLRYTANNNLPETLQKLCFSTKFHTKKLCEIAVFYAVIAPPSYLQDIPHHNCLAWSIGCLC